MIGPDFGHSSVVPKPDVNVGPEPPAAGKGRKRPSHRHNLRTRNAVQIGSHFFWVKSRRFWKANTSRGARAGTLPVCRATTWHAQDK
jgi:hypothetical protein